jgi:hypothetical protein
MGYKVNNRTMTVGSAAGKHADEWTLSMDGIPAALTTTQDTTVQEVDKGTWCADLVVASATGTTPTLDVAVKTSKDNVSYRTISSFTQATAAGSERKSFTGCDRFVKCTLTVAGTTPVFNGVTIIGDAK